jgi:hypothetical protein
MVSTVLSHLHRTDSKIAAEILLFIQERNRFLYTCCSLKASNYYASQSHLVHEEYLPRIPTYQNLLKQEFHAEIKNLVV